MNEFDYIKYNLDNILGTIERAALKSGRKLKDIRLIAVTKTVDTQRIKGLLGHGVVDLGENRVQELTQKYDILKENVCWHLIGHLQTNKVKYIIDKVSMIHSVDRMELGKEINRLGEKEDKVCEVLVQVNVSGEETKSGISPFEAINFIENLSLLKNIKVKGLMTMAPFAENPEKIRYVFAKLRELSIDIKKEKIDNIDMDYLSMGMSNDYEVAIEEGSNMVRIGTALFKK